MLLSAVSVLVVAQLSSEIPEGLLNYPVYFILEHASQVKYTGALYLVVETARNTLNSTL
jgi:hypothetical protein